MWPFDKKDAQITKQDVEKAVKQTVPEFTHEDQKKLIEFEQKHKEQIKKERLRQFALLPIHIRQSILDWFNIRDFYTNFINAEHIPISREHSDLQDKKEQWNMIKGLSNARSIYRTHDMMSVAGRWQSYASPQSDFNFLLSYDITYEELEKTHWDASTDEEILNTDTTNSLYGRGSNVK